MDNPKKTELDKESRRDLDSLYRFYGSQITAHSNYLVAYAFAVAVYFYKWLDRLLLPNNPPVGYDLTLIGLIPFFILLGLFFVGRLFYYNELSNLVHVFMGLYHVPELPYSNFIELVQKEKEKGSGLADIIVTTLYCRIKFRFFRKVGCENHIGLYERYSISPARSILIILANVRSSEYRDLLKGLVTGAVTDARCPLDEELKILRVTCYDCRTLNLIPYSGIGNEPIKCEKCGRVLVVRE